MVKHDFPVTKAEAKKRGIAYSSEANKNAVFPQRLKKLRNEKNVSQDTFSKELGISKSTLGLYETGDTLPDAETLYKMAKYFDVSADYILCLSDIRHPSMAFRTACDFIGVSSATMERLISIKNSPAHINGVELLLATNYFIETLPHISTLSTAIKLKERIVRSEDDSFLPNTVDLETFHASNLFALAIQEIKQYADEHPFKD